MVINRIASALEMLRRTPADKQALEEHEREIATDREVHVAAIEEAQAKLHDALPKLNDAVAKADAQWERARKAADAAEATHRAARLDLNNAVHRAGHARDTHQLELAKGADPRIAEMARKLIALYMREARGGLIVEYEKTGVFQQLTGDAHIRVSDNSAARSRRMIAMRDAIVAIKDLKFSGKADVSDEARAILEGIPDGTKLEFVYESYSKALRGRTSIDLYRPIDVAEAFSEVLQPVEFVSRDDHGRDDGGTGGGIDIASVRPMAI